MMEIRKILERHGLKPSKRLGQNFLIAEWVYEKILAAAELTPQDVVLEIGAGLGTLTRRLAEQAGHVVAVELDARLIEILRETLQGLANVSLHQGDILAMDPAALVAPWLVENGRYKVVANLPYYITSHALRHLLEASLQPERLVLMVQREVADRIVAPPGEMSLLAISVRAYGTAEQVCRVPPDAFYPAPRVSSAILVVRLHPVPLVSEACRERFFQVVRAGFQQRRKQLHNSLAANLGLERSEVYQALKEAGIDPMARPQSLDVADWVRLTEALFPPEIPNINPPQGEGSSAFRA